MDNGNRLNIGPVLRWGAVTAAGYIAVRVTLLVLPHAAVGLIVGVAEIGVMVVFIVRGVKACGRGELTLGAKPDRDPAPGETPNARVQTRTRADAQARAREAA